jgi:FHS family glucose/mannose:H+ symporter-like MFS transporter
MERSRIIAGFLLSGFLLALLGAILPAWGYHRDPAEFIAVGNYFLCLAVGIVAANELAERIRSRRGLPFLLVAGCALSCAALLYMAAVGPPRSAWWRAGGLLALGIGAGWINSALFHGISARYRNDPAGTAVIGGIWYGIGCLAATLLVAGTFYAYTVPSILIFMAVVPGMFAVGYARSSTPMITAPGANRSLREVLDDFRSLGAILWALLLFFQFGNEWSIAGWLPIFLIRRVGLSPSASLTILALYWSFLLIGRVVAIALLPRMRHTRLLMGSVLAAMFGCLILFSTNNAFGAGTGAIFVGGGFASIYPLVSESIGRRFPYYHPGFFNGIFTFAQVGGLLAPATLGYAAQAWGVGVVLGIPLVGTIMVMLLSLAIWLESRVTGR